MTLPYYYTTTIRARLSADQIQQALITNSTDGTIISMMTNGVFTWQ